MNTYPIKSWHILAITTPYAIGSVANLVVWLVNGGMPSKLNPKWAISHNGASLLTSHTKLAFLADIIKIKSYYFSIGDFLIYSVIPLYIGFTLFWTIKRLRRNKSWQKS
jgi:hypothetical protein